jgi:hypothetical protein
MTIHSANDDAHFIAASLDILNRNSVKLTIGTDFEEYRSLLAEGRSNHLIGAPFDPLKHNLNEANSVWVVGRDADNRIMHTQALKVLDLEQRTLAEYLRRKFDAFPPSGMDIDYKRSRYRPGPGAQRIAGRVVYHGEVWMGGQPGQYRGTGLSGILGRYAFLLAMQRFAPDYVFGFMPKPVAYKGFVERQGYMHAEPGSLRWFVKGNDEPLEGFMAYMANEDIRFILDMPLRELMALAA